MAGLGALGQVQLSNALATYQRMMGLGPAAQAGAGGSLAVPGGGVPVATGAPQSLAVRAGQGLRTMRPPPMGVYGNVPKMGPTLSRLAGYGSKIGAMNPLVMGAAAALFPTEMGDGTWKPGTGDLAQMTPEEQAAQKARIDALPQAPQAPVDNRPRGLYGPIGPMPGANPGAQASVDNTFPSQAQMAAGPVMRPQYNYDNGEFYGPADPARVKALVDSVGGPGDDAPKAPQAAPRPPTRRSGKKAGPSAAQAAAATAAQAQAAQLAAFQQAKQQQAQDYYMSRLNPLGGTSEYADLQRGRLNDYRR